MQSRYMRVDVGVGPLAYGVALGSPSASFIIKRSRRTAEIVPVPLRDLPLYLPATKNCSWSEEMAVPDAFAHAPERLLEHDVLLAHARGREAFVLSLADRAPNPAGHLPSVSLVANWLLQAEPPSSCPLPLVGSLCGKALQGRIAWIACRDCPRAEQIFPSAPASWFRPFDATHPHVEQEVQATHPLLAITLAYLDCSCDGLASLAPRVSRATRLSIARELSTSLATRLDPDAAAAYVTARREAGYTEALSSLAGLAEGSRRRLIAAHAKTRVSLN